MELKRTDLQLLKKKHRFVDRPKLLKQDTVFLEVFQDVYVCRAALFGRLTMQMCLFLGDHLCAIGGKIQGFRPGPYSFPIRGD